MMNVPSRCVPIRPLYCILLIILPALSSVHMLTAAMKIADYAAKPFVQRVCQEPMKPQSVLSFFFGVDYSDPNYKEQLRQGKSLFDMKDYWFGGGPDYDKLCQPFAETVRAAGTKQLQDESLWCLTIDGLMAQLLLCDQLARNIFRGTTEAFLYDDTAVEIARRLTTSYLAMEDGKQCSSDLKGEFYPPYVHFIGVSLMHSESLQDHENCLKLIHYARQEAPDHLKKCFDDELKYELDHKRIIDQFGRYPHRNALKGRTNTQAEAEWLADTENLPLWAKSQS